MGFSLKLSPTFIQGFIPTLVLIPLLFITGFVDSLHGVRLEVPRYVLKGEEVVLKCLYELGNDSLYAIKWFRGTEELCRFVPKEFPPQKIFSYPGIQFNNQYCNDHDVFLRNVSIQTSGKYKCVVSAETTFQTFMIWQELTVVAVNDIPPSLEVEQESYYPGERVKANCSLDNVSHPANFTWFINGGEMPSSSSRSISLPSSSSSSLIKSLSVLNFEMSSVKSREGGGMDDEIIRVKCKAQLFDLYSEMSEEIVLHPVKPKFSPASKMAVNGGGEKGAIIKSKLILLLSTSYFWL